MFETPHPPQAVPLPLRGRLNLCIAKFIYSYANLFSCPLFLISLRFVSIAFPSGVAAFFIKNAVPTGFEFFIKIQTWTTLVVDEV